MGQRRPRLSGCALSPSTPETLFPSIWTRMPHPMWQNPHVDLIVSVAFIGTSSRCSYPYVYYTPFCIAFKTVAVRPAHRAAATVNGNKRMTTSGNFLPSRVA